jgi:hypothetical protein
MRSQRSSLSKCCQPDGIFSTRMTDVHTNMCLQNPCWCEACGLLHCCKVWRPLWMGFHTPAIPCGLGQTLRGRSASRKSRVHASGMASHHVSKLWGASHINVDDCVLIRRIPDRISSLYTRDFSSVRLSTHAMTSSLRCFSQSMHALYPVHGDKPKHKGVWRWMNDAWVFSFFQ